MKTLFALLRRSNSIAKDLHKLVMLYELELASRNPPIMLRTETPSEKDTEVTYMGISERKRRFTDFFGAPKDTESEEDLEQGV